jgi:hypothetical protein
MTRPRRTAPRGPLGVLGASLVTAIGALALLGPLVLAGNPLAAAGTALQPPGGVHLLGTDDLGRDVLLGVVYGARVSLLAGGIAALTSALLGTAVGAAAGFYGPPLDDVLMRLTEAVLVAPRFFLAVLVAALFGPSLWYLALLLGLTFWPQTARLLRPGPVAAAARVCGCCAGGGTHPRSHSRAARAPECWIGSRHHGSAAGRRRDSGRGQFELSGIGRPEPDQLGLHAEQRPALSAPGMVDVRISGPGARAEILRHWRGVRRRQPLSGPVRLPLSGLTRYARVE